MSPLPATTSTARVLLLLHAAAAAADHASYLSAATAATSAPEAGADYDDYGATTSAAPACSRACLHRRQIEQDTVEGIKRYILDRLGLSEPPKVPAHLRPPQSAIDVLLNRSAGALEEAGDDEQGDQAPRPSLDEELLRPGDCDEDDDDVRPRKVIAFAEARGNDSKQCERYEGNQVNFFRFSKDVMHHKVASAKLWVHLQPPAYLNYTAPAGKQFAFLPPRGATVPPQFAFLPPRGAAGARHAARGAPGGGHAHRHARQRGAAEAVVLTVELADANTGHGLRKSVLASHKFLVPAHRGKWVHVDLTRTVAEWFRRMDGELALVLTAADVSGKEIKLSDDDYHNGQQTPFIELTPLWPPRPPRSRRSLGMDCNGKTDEKRCCRYPLIIDFEEFAWDWIIAPKTYQANYCAGDCPYVFLQKYPHSYLVQVTNRTICCAPRKMSSISMLYFNTEHNILHSTLPGMTVEKCGCF